jgi:hypothetical protein
LEICFLKKNWLKKSFNRTSLGQNAQKAVQRNTIRREKKSLNAFFTQLLAFSYKLQAKNKPFF